MEDYHKLALETLNLSKQAIIFNPSRASAEKTAEDIAKLLSENLPELEEGIIKAASTPTKQCKRLAACVRKGIAFHHAGLLQGQKDLVEENFKNGKIKIICATPTLAAGLSLPVFRVIIKSLKRFSGRWGMDWIPVLEYLQMAGRAGRPEYEKLGEAICLAKNEAEKDEIHSRYILGQPEEIYSKLAVEPVLRTYLLSLISSGIIRDEKSMQGFFSKTFWAAQFKDMAKLGDIMERMLSLLEEWGFVQITGEEKGDFVIASSIGNHERILRATPLGRRISELYLDPLTARHLLTCLAKFNSEHTAFSLLQIISHTLEMRPLLSVKRKEEEEIYGELNQRYQQLLDPEPSAFDPEYGDFLDSVKTALFFSSWIEENNEDFLLDKFGITPGVIRYKLEAADWLLYACEELSKVMLYREAVKDIVKLRLRVKQGVKEELLPLMKLKGIGRIRARKLHSNGVKDLGDFNKIDPTSLAQLLGKTLALDVKKQIGEEVHEVSKGKRKGQLSLEKF